jgi:hypothetical protein
MNQQVINPKVKVIDSLWTFTVAVAFAGPFALPLLWRNPRFSLRTKIISSILVIALTLAILWIFEVIVKDSYQKFQDLKEMQNQMQNSPQSADPQ